MTDILDVLRRKRAQDGIKRITRATGMAKNTLSSYIHLAAEHGFRDSIADRYEHLSEIAAAIFRSVHGSVQKTASTTTAMAPLFPHRDLIGHWLEKADLARTKSHINRGRMGVLNIVPCTAMPVTSLVSADRRLR